MGVSLGFLAVCSSLTRHLGHIKLIHIVPTAKRPCILLEVDDVLVHFRMMHNNLTRRDDCVKKKRKIGFRIR